MRNRKRNDSQNDNSRNGSAPSPHGSCWWCLKDLPPREQQMFCVRGADLCLACFPRAIARAYTVVPGAKEWLSECQAREWSVRHLN